MSDVTVFEAKRIITMDPGRPDATAVAVRDGRILSVGSLESMRPWLDRHAFEVDTTFSDRVVMPGFVDPHMHLRRAGAVVTGLHYLGPTTSPIGAPGQATRAEVFDFLDKLHASAPADEQIFAWGFDPAYQGGHLNRDELDRVSGERPIVILAYAMHFLYLNSAALKLTGATEGLDLHGMGRDSDGRLNGVFAEKQATRFAMKPFRTRFYRREAARSGLLTLANIAQSVGITTTSDMGVGAEDFEEELADHLDIVSRRDFPLRISLTPAEIAMDAEHGEDAADFVADLGRYQSDKLRFHGIKMWLDGSYQAMSLRVNYPGYLDGGNGLRGEVPWPDLVDRMMPYWERGIQIHAHANGDEAIDAALDTLAELQHRKPRFDHRFTIEHYLISSPSQARRLAKLGGLASVLIYYLHHRSELQNLEGLGPDRAEATGRLGSLAREGVVFGLHSDFAFGLFPLSPLESVWMSVTRLGIDGKTCLAPGERISIERALRAITIDSAYLLGMENEVGSIEVGKYADFTVLDEDPLTIDVSRVKDIPIWGTVLGGVKQPGSGS